LLNELAADFYDMGILCNVWTNAWIAVGTMYK
jgi:hypothetical protein